MVQLILRCERHLRVCLPYLVLLNQHYVPQERIEEKREENHSLSVPFVQKDFIVTQDASNQWCVNPLCIVQNPPATIQCVPVDRIVLFNHQVFSIFLKFKIQKNQILLQNPFLAMMVIIVLFIAVSPLHVQQERTVHTCLMVPFPVHLVTEDEQHLSLVDILP